MWKLILIFMMAILISGCLEKFASIDKLIVQDYDFRKSEARKYYTGDSFRPFSLRRYKYYSFGYKFSDSNSENYIELSYYPLKSMGPAYIVDGQGFLWELSDSSEIFDSKTKTYKNMWENGEINADTYLIDYFKKNRNKWRLYGEIIKENGKYKIKNLISLVKRD